MNKSKKFEKEGLELLNKGNDQKALECFGKAVCLDHLNYQALRNMLLTAHRLGLTLDAAITIRDLVQEYPSDTRLLAIAREYTDLVQGKVMAMAPLTTIFLSKDRPMQLLGCLESLFHHSRITQESITVLYKQTGNIYYDLLIDKYKGIRWVPEHSFYQDVQSLFNESNDYILMCCDDIIFTEPFDLEKCIKVIGENEDIFDFTLGFGRNIPPLPENLIDNGQWLKWKWYNPVAANWHYSWSIYATLYRKHDVLRLTQPFADVITNPGSLEGTVARSLQEYPDKAPPCRASFKHSKCIAIQVNHTQDNNLNKHEKSNRTESEQLYDLFLHGGTLDWQKFSNIDNSVFKPDGEFCRVKLDQNPHGNSYFKKFLELLPFDNPYDNFNFGAVPKDISGGGGDHVFDKYLEKIDVHLIIEVGSWKGASAIHFGSYLKERNIDGVVICIDTWLGTINNMIEHNDPIWGLRKYYVNGYPRLYTQFLANISHMSLQNYIVPFPNTSSIGAKWLKHHGIMADFIYIDGSHEEEDVYKDILDYWPIVKTKGFLTGDDWHSGGEGVKNAVTRFVKEHNLNLEIAGTKWIIRKS